MGLREGWTQELVDQILTEHKELFRIAAEHGAMFIPPWLDDNDLREYLIEQLMIREPELTGEEIIKKAEELIKSYDEKEEKKEYEESYLCTTGRHYDLALTDPDALREEMIVKYKRAYPEKEDKWIEEKVAERIECLKIGAVRRLERMKKIEVV